LSVCTATQGKWILEKGKSDGAPVTVLKYAAEVAMATGPLRSLGLIEPLLERGIIEDVPAALAAIKRAAEGKGPAARDAAGAMPARVYERFEVLRTELARLYSDKGAMPDRTELLERGRCARADADAGNALRVLDPFRRLARLTGLQP
jgi:hypothetical protein